MSANLKYYFTVSEYERLGETGILPPNARVELIEGEIVEMSPTGSRHAGCVNLLSRILNQQVRDLIVATQNPLRLSDLSEPQPDIALLRFRQDFYRRRHPGPDDVLVVIEVADTTVHYDRHVKMPLYARAGIPEALLFNLPEDRLEYFARPEAGVYQVNEFINRGERFESTSIAGVTLDIEMILG